MSGSEQVHGRFASMRSGSTGWQISSVRWSLPRTRWRIWRANSGEGLDRKHLAQGLLASQAAIERLVAELHGAVMDVRMMPMRDIFRRFPRAVRETAGHLGKAINFSMEGEEVEADKAVVEGLFEPLLHLLRNAVGHGAEPEHLRLEVGKAGKSQDRAPGPSRSATASPSKSRTMDAASIRPRSGRRPASVGSFQRTASIA